MHLDDKKRYRLALLAHWSLSISSVFISFQPEYAAQNSIEWPSKIGSMDGKKKRNRMLDFERTFSNIDVLYSRRLSRLDLVYCLRNT